MFGWKRHRQCDIVSIRIVEVEDQPVYNLTVKDGYLPEFYANGILTHNCSISGIPLVKYTGISPHGLNASSEGELRVFYDWIHSFQEQLFTKHLKRIIRFIQLSLWGEVDDDIIFEYEPLWALDEKGEAEVRKVQAETDNILVDMGALAPAEVRKREGSDPASPHKGLVIEDLPDLKQEEEQGLQPRGTKGMGGGFGGEEDEAIDDLEAPRSRYQTLAGLIHMAPEVQQQLLHFIRGKPEEDDAFTPELTAKAFPPQQYMPMSRKQKLAVLLRGYNEIADDDIEESRFQILGKLLNRIPVETLVKLISGGEGKHQFSDRMQKFVKLMNPSTTHTEGIQKLAAILNGGDEDKDPNSRFSKLASLLGGGESTVVPFVPPFDSDNVIDLGNDAYAYDEAGFEESEHPRDADGKFKTGAGTSFKNKMDVIHHLLKKGTHASTVLKHTGWPSVSMPAMAKALGVELVKSKEPGGKTKYSIKGGATTTKEKDFGKLLKEANKESAEVKSSSDKYNNFAEGKLSFGSLSKVGGQLGSNEGGTYADDLNNKKYYIKKGKSKEHVKNELLAAKLYNLAGSPTLKYKEVMGDDRIATEWQAKQKDNFKNPTEDELTKAQSDFATHAWLANWDAAGLDYDNLAMIDGKAVNVDLGGALLYRAMGDPKGDKFGTEVGEWDTLRDPKVNKQNAEIFGSMYKEELKVSAEKVINIPDQKIYDAVEEMGFPKSLGDKLINRKYDIATKTGLTKQADEVNAAFEALHKRDAQGHFISTGGGEEPKSEYEGNKKLDDAKNLIKKGYLAGSYTTPTEAEYFLKDNLADSEIEVLVSTYGSLHEAVMENLNPTIKHEAKEAPKSEPSKPVEKATTAELEKAKKGTPYPESSSADIPNALKAIQNFNKMYSGKDLSDPVQLEMKVFNFKEMKAKVEKAKTEHQGKQQEEAKAKQKAEADKLAAQMNDPETKAHYEVLAGIGLNKNYIAHAEQKIKEHKLDITPLQGAFIQAYVGSHYGPVNKQLREGVLSEEQYKYSKVLGDALDKMPKYEGTVHRGVSLDSSQFAKYKNAVGKVVLEDGFSSAGVKQKLWGSHTFVIQSKTAADIRSFNPSEGGGEVVFKHHTPFKVVSVSGNTIHMEEV